jgi:hypothetical protein
VPVDHEHRVGRESRGGDVGIEDANITTAEIGSESLLIGLQTGDPLAEEANIELRRLNDRTLGIHPARLFPAWHAAQRQILADADLAPPIAELDDTDLVARSWTRQPEVEWIMLIGSLLAGHDDTIVRPARGWAVPFTLSWLTHPSRRSAVRRFIESSVHAELPAGWLPVRSDASAAEARVVELDDLASDQT